MMTVKEFNPEGVTGREDDNIDKQILYRSWVTGPDGAHYSLFREKHHTKEDVDAAKAYLRRNFDVLSIEIVKET